MLILEKFSLDISLIFADRENKNGNTSSYSRQIRPQPKRIGHDSNRQAAALLGGCQAPGGCHRNRPGGLDGAARRPTSPKTRAKTPATVPAKEDGRIDPRGPSTGQNGHVNLNATPRCHTRTGERELTHEAAGPFSNRQRQGGRAQQFRGQSGSIQRRNSSGTLRCDLRRNHPGLLPGTAHHGYSVPAQLRPPGRRLLRPCENPDGPGGQKDRAAHAGDINQKYLARLCHKRGQGVGRPWPARSTVVAQIS